MRYLIVILVTCFILFSCKENRNTKSEKILIKEKVSNDKLISKETLDTLWDNLVFEKGGCLTGGQYSLNEDLVFEGCVLKSDKKWNRFLKSKDKEVFNFLIGKFNSKKKQKYIHVLFSLLQKEN